MAEQKKAIARIEIEPAENGGHTVTHRYKPRPMYRGGRHGLTTDYPEAETHVFGPEDHKKMLTHVAKHLGAKPEPDEDGE